MIRLQPRRCAQAATILLLSGLAACGHTGATHYLRLAAIPPAAPAPPDAATVPVNVGRLSVRFPAAFDRLEVVRPIGDVDLAVEELTRWSAAPAELAVSALAQDLQARLPSLILTPVGRVPSPDTQDISVQVVALDERDQTYSLTASIVIESANGARRTVHALTVSTPSKGSGAEAEAKALSRLFAAVADRIVPDLIASVSSPAEYPARSSSRHPTP